MKRRLLSGVSAMALAVLLAGGLSPVSPAGAAAPPPLPEVIVDNPDKGDVGTWTLSKFKPNYYGATGYLTTPKASTVTASVRFTPDVPVAGTYGVYYWLPDGGTDRAWDIPFRVHDALGDVGYSVSAQPARGGEWILLGNHTFEVGTTGYVEVTNKAGAVVVADAIKLGAPSEHVDYRVRPDIEKQTILGIGVEIQSDSIGSGNNGLPDDSPAYVPGDLTPSERQRFYDEMLTGFRYVRLAMGLYLRGLTPDRKNIVERYSGQMEQLAEMIEESGIEGANVEYWSPAPYWKDNDSFVRGSLDLVHIEDQAERDAWVDEYSDAMVQDIEYLESHGIPVKQWSLQNEPTALTGYSSVYLDHQEYYEVFRQVAKKIKERDPSVYIHGDSHHGQTGQGSALIKSDPEALKYLDAWSHHRNWGSSDELIDNRVAINSGLEGKDVFNSEWEFLDDKTSETRMIETAQSIMNWMTFMDAPTWYWLHALKPTYNKESEGYGLGLWRPSDDPIEPGDPYADIAPQHWAPIKTNWHGVAPFVQHLPWDSTRLQVDEKIVRKGQRIMAWESPDGDLGIALTNRSDSPFRFNIDLGDAQTLYGHRYDKTVEDQELAAKSGQVIQVIVPPKSIEIWTEDDGASAPVLQSAQLSASDLDLVVGDSATTTLAGTLSDGVAADLAGAAIEYSSSDPSVASVDEAGRITALSGGTTEVSATVTSGESVVSTNALAVRVSTAPLATARPGSPALSSNIGHAHGLALGDFTLSMNMWWGQNATSVRLYEGDTLIGEKTLRDATPAAQSASFPITGKPNGTYVYRAELVNPHGVTSSTPLTVTVKDAAPGRPALSHDNWDGDGSFAVTADLWWGTNATSYRVFEDGVLLDEGSLTAATPLSQRVTTRVAARTPGTHSYRVELVNAAGVTSSGDLMVQVRP
ncbi:Ig-like domain-containing protein [Microbacterium sp. RU33B]|uniref:golvesin C-terminal-like domain-containing protein n=1 Tax=Microbacterium sp. RU33B TaxID=1907390 RepID=UPI00095F0F3D|nr:Ig-like domain-containing protein [Microbacterium sp. RU33B]SIT89757.1 Ig-like domain (group 2) [Microbacterium sp. RU33B]